MRDLAKYSFANAKIRAMLSYLIDPAQFSRLLQAKDIYEILDLLKGTLYAESFKTMEKEKIDLQKIEMQLLRNDLNVHRKIYNALSSQREKYFISLLIERYELEELKVILRLWHKKVNANIEDYILDNNIKFEIDFKKIISAQNIEEIIILLDHTPYKAPLLSGREKFKERNSSFYLEAALDADYYQRLIRATDDFSSLDRKIAQKILGVEIDIENINWLVRLRKYYSLGIGEMIDLVIAGGERINKSTVRGFYVSDGLGKIIESLARGPYAKLKDLFEGNIYFLEQFLYEVLSREIRKALAGFPFTIGIAFGYLVLKRKETQNIISLLYAKNLGLKVEETEHLLNI
ncbi:MAG: V-type ATPase subunit [Candidatus Omnitrophota bacterium]|nr:V-type ATPase subunit [Candidatus Omnitrophota bacterium]